MTSSKAAPRYSAWALSLPRRQGLAGTETPAILLDRVTRGSIVAGRGRAGCRRFVHVQGDGTGDITLRDCRAPEGASLVTFESDALRAAVRLS